MQLSINFSQVFVRRLGIRIENQLEDKRRENSIDSDPAPERKSYEPTKEAVNPLGGLPVR